jgi:hypothetical protein
MRIRTFNMIRQLAGNAAPSGGTVFAAVGQIVDM